jgi:hypothetical protein
MCKRVNYLKQRITTDVAWARHLLHAGFLGWFSTLKMEVISSSESSIHIRTTRLCITYDDSVHVNSNCIYSQTTVLTTALPSCVIFLSINVACLNLWSTRLIFLCTSISAKAIQWLSCTIWGFHGGGYEERRLLGCDAVWLLQESPFIFTLFLTRWFFQQWWWRRYFPLKYLFLQKPQDITSQKTAFFSGFLFKPVLQNEHFITAE